MNKTINYNIKFNTDTSQIQNVTAQLQNLQNISTREIALRLNKSNIDAEVRQIQTDVKQAAQVIQDALNSAFDPVLNTTSISKFNSEIMSSATGATTLGTRMSQLGGQMSQAGAQGQVAFRNVASSLLTTQKQTRQTSAFMQQLGQTMMSSLKWSLAYGAINKITNGIGEAWNYIKELDRSLNDIRIVTEKSAEEMDRFADKANRAAKSLGSATTSYTKAALIYYQQGLADEDVEARANVTIKAANVTGQSAAEVSEQLTAVWNGYRVVAEEAELYIDKLAKVAASTASDLQELSEGMSKVASSASAMGIDINQLTAALSTVISATRQDAASVGTAFKTIFARMGDLQVSGVDEFGVKLGDVSGKMKQMGIDVLDETGNLRDMGLVIEEVAEKWGTWTEAQQQAAAVALAGKRQYNNLIALFENWDKYTESKATAEGAEGTLEKQNQIYLDSLEAKLQQMGTAGERVKKALFDSESFKDVLDSLTTIIDKFGMMIETIGGGGPIFTMLIGTLLTGFGPKLANGIMMTVNNFKLLKTNARETQAQMELSAQFVNYQDSAIQKMAQIKQKEYEYTKLITEEERKQLNLYIEQVGEAQNEIDIQRQQLEEAKQYYAQNSNEGNTVGDGYNQGGAEVSDLDEYDRVPANTGVLTQEQASMDLEQKAANLDLYEQETMAIEKTTQALERKAQTTGLDNAENEKLAASTDELNAKIKEFGNNGSLTADQVKKLENSKGTASQKAKMLAQELAKNSAEAKKYSQILKEATPRIESASQALNKTTAAADRLTGSLGKRAVIANFVTALGGLSTVASSVSMLVSTLKSFNDESLSLGDKVLNAFTTLPMVITMGAMEIKSILPLFTALYAKTGNLIAIKTIEHTLDLKRATGEQKEIIRKKILAQLTEEQQRKYAKLTEQELIKLAVDGKLETASGKQIVLETAKGNAMEVAGNKGFVASLKILGVWGAIILAVIAIIALMVSLFKPKNEKSQAEILQERFEAASKAAEEARENVKALKDEYDALMSDITKYRDARNALDEMRKGTDEWKNSVADLNLQVLDLIGKYDGLTLSVDENGIYTINQNSIDEMLSRKQAAQRQANNVLLATELNKNIAKYNLDNYNLTKDDSIEGYYKENFRNTQPLTFWKDSDESKLLSEVIGVTGEDFRGNISYSLNDIQTAINEMSKNELANLQKLLKDSEKYDESLANALLGTTDALLRNEQVLEKNNIALKSFKEGYITSAFSEDLGEGGAKVYSDIVSNMDIDMDTNKIQGFNKLANLGGDGVADKDADVESARNAVKSMATTVFGDNVSVSGIDFKDKSKADIYDSVIKVDGKEMTVRELDSYYKEKKLKENIGKATANLDENIAAINEGGGNVNMAYFLSNSIYDKNKGANEQIFDWVEANASEIDSLTKFSKEEFDKLGLVDENGNALNYDDYLNNIKDYQEAFKGTMDAVLGEVGYSLTDQFKNFTQDDADNFVNGLKKAEFAGGGDLIKSLFTGKDAEATSFINDALAKVNFTDAASVSAFVSAMAEQDYIIDENAEAWETFLNDTVLNGTKQWIQDSQKVIDNLATIKDLAENIKIGNILSDEDYKKLIAINPMIASSFVKTAGGYVALESGQEISEKLKKQYGGLQGITTEYANITAAAKNSGKTGNLNLNVDTSTDLLNYLDDFEYDTSKDLLEAAGFTGDGTKFAELLTAIGNGESWAISEGTALAKNLNQVLLDVENGEFDAGAAQQVYGTSVAKSWSEAKGAFDIKDENGNVVSTDTTSEDYKKVKAYWQNQYRTEMGLVGDTLLKDLSMEELEAQVKRVKELEQDRYSAIEKDIEQLGKVAENSLGANKFKALQDIAEQQDEVVEIAQKRAAYAKTNADNLLTKSDLTKYGWTETTSPTLNDLFDLQLNFSKDDDEWNEIQNIIDALITAEELGAEVFDKIAEGIDAQFAVFDAVIQTRLDLSEAKRDWNEFKAKYVEKDGLDLFGDTSGQEQKSISQENYKAYKADYEQYKGIMDSFIQKGMVTQDPVSGEHTIADIFANNPQFMEKYNQVTEGMKTAFEGMFSSAEEIFEAYATIQEEILEQYDEQIKKLSTINSLYSSSADLLKLIGGNTDKYANTISGFYQNTRENAEKSLALANEQLAATQYAYNKDYENATEEQKKVLEENLSTAASNAINAASEVANAAINEFENAFSTAVNSAFGAGGLTGLSEQWERDLYFDERYLDETNKAYSIEELGRKIQKSIDETDSYSAQKKLNDLKQKELDLLEKKDKLTQDDLDRANARYELELKKIALEEAQQTASKMKLVRDASGNYSYQYVADEEAVTKAEEEYSKAENDLYNLGKDQTKSTIGDLIGKYQEAMEAIGSAQTAEQKQTLYDHYFGTDGVIELLKEDLNTIIGDDQGADKYISSYQDTIDKLMAGEVDTSISGAFKKLMEGDGSNPGFISTMSDLTSTLDEAFGEDGSLITVISKLTNAIVQPEGTTFYDYSNQVDSASDILKLFKEDGFLSSIQSIADNISKLTQANIANLESQVGSQATDANTAALESLTLAILTNNDLLDKTLDGKMNGTEIKYGNYKFDEDNGFWKLDQSVQGNNP